MEQDLTQDVSIKPASTRTLLIIGFSFVTVVMMVIALYGVHSMSGLSEKLTSIVSDNNVRLKYAYEMRDASRMRTVILHRMARTGDPFERDDLLLEFRDQGAKFLLAREKIVEHGLDKESAVLLAQQRKYSSMAGPLQYRVIDLLNEDRPDEAINVLIYEVIPAQNLAISVIDEFISRQQSRYTGMLDEIQREFDASLQVIVIFMLAGMAVSVLVSLIVLRHTNIILQAMYDSKVREKVIRENIVDAVITFNEDGVIESANKAVYEIFGYHADEFEGQKMARLLSVFNIMRNYSDIDASKLAGVVNSTRTIKCIHKDGHEIVLHVGISKVLLNDKSLYIAVFSDITDQVQAEESLLKMNESLELRVEERTRELQEANEKLKYLASHDTVTELPNRALLTEHLGHILAGARRMHKKVALFFLDIDGFKQVNDAYGHEVGDKLLKKLGERMGQALRQSDLIARVGGDEFIVVLDDVADTRHLTNIAGKLIEVIGEPVNITDHICRVGVSIGISIYPQDGEDIETLISRADKAMYKIKSTGKNNHGFYRNISSVS